MDAIYKNIYNITHEILSLIPILLFYVWAIYALILLADRKPPADQKNGHFITDSIIPGTDAIIEFTVDRKQSCEVDYIQSLYDSDGVRHILPDYPTAGKRPLGNNIKFKYTIPVPQSISKGVVRYESSRTYICNWTQRIFPLIVQNDDIFTNVE